MEGPPPLWLTEWLWPALDLPPGAGVLDLGCGTALTSIFLAEEYGAQVVAADLWVDHADFLDFDVDLLEIQGQERLDEFCRSLQAVGQHLGKPVLMGDESGNPATQPVLGFSAESGRVVVICPPPAS